MASKLSIGISVITIIFSILVVVWFANSSMERTDQATEALEESIKELDRIVDKAIVHCQTDGLGCDVIMPQWLEECKKSEMKEIPSCHDGRIESLIGNPIVMSDECRELKEIMEQNRHGANNNDPQAIGEFGLAMNDYNKLGCQ